MCCFILIYIHPGLCWIFQQGSLDAHLLIVISCCSVNYITEHSCILDYLCIALAVSQISLCFGPGCLICFFSRF